MMSDIRIIIEDRQTKEVYFTINPLGATPPVPQQGEEITLINIWGGEKVGIVAERKFIISLDMITIRIFLDTSS